MYRIYYQYTASSPIICLDDRRRVKQRGRSDQSGVIQALSLDELDLPFFGPSHL